MAENTHPTHVYVARKLCGCVVGLVTDLGDKQTGKHVAEFIGSGLAVNRHDWATYREKIALELTFMACPHGQSAMFLKA
jgi:hypothetical protein